MPVCDFNPSSEEYADFIVWHNNETPEQLKQQFPSLCLDYINPEYAVVYPPLAEVEPITIEKYSYSAIPKLYTLLDTTSMEASGILKTFRQPTLNIRGEGTLIGFIDTGIDYRNPLFQNPDGSTRILGIWDQTLPLPTGTSEESFGIPAADSAMSFSYGRQYNQTEINQALQSENPYEVVPSRDESGHGTFVAGIAAGNTSSSQDFTGAAPACAIGIVKLKPAKQYLRDFYLIQESAEAYQENDIMMGIKYLELLSFQSRLPLVIYIGAGTNYGSHEGTSPLGLTLNSLRRLIGVCAVLPAGNEAGLRHHYLGRLAENQEYDDVEIRVGPDERGFVAELWASAPELYTVGFVSPTGEVIPRVPLSLGVEVRISFTLEAASITVDYGTSEIGSGSQLIFMRFNAPTPGIWHIRVYNSLFISGLFHIWLPVQSFIKEDTFFLNADPDTTITEPANAYPPITVSTYNHRNNSIYIHSSRGYTRTGLIKPDLAAPGVDIEGPGLPSPAEPDVFPMIRRTGSSIAAAHTAGAVACLFTWGIVRGNNPAMSDVAVRSYLIRGAGRNPSYSYPNREWGYGTLDLYQTFLRIRE